jgi:hypothetical protein
VLTVLGWAVAPAARDLVGDLEQQSPTLAALRLAMRMYAAGISPRSSQG